MKDLVSVAVIRGEVNKFPKLTALTEQATGIILDLLGPSRATISMEWDVAEDCRRGAVLVLKLSDLTGRVAAAFSPSELEDGVHLRDRLNHLWGDLLEIRSHQQLQRLIGPGAPVLSSDPAA
jgi:hypothetical protein